MSKEFLSEGDAVRVYDDDTGEWHDAKIVIMNSQHAECELDNGEYLAVFYFNIEPIS